MIKNKQIAGGMVIAGLLAVFALMGPTNSLFANTASAGYGGNGDGNASKVTICHNGSTIMVSQSAVAAHMKHGDTVGACAPTPVVLGASTSNAEQIQTLNVRLMSLLQQLLGMLQALK